MGLLSSIWNLIKRIVKKIIDVVKKVLKALWPLILVVAAIYFAPAIGAWFNSAGFTTLGGWFTSIGTSITPTLVGWLDSAWAGVASLGASTWTAFKGLSLGTQAAIVTGAAAVLAPDETADVISDVGTIVGEVGGSLIGGAISGLPGWIWLAGAGLLFVLLSRNRNDDDTAN